MFVDVHYRCLLYCCPLLLLLCVAVFRWLLFVAGDVVRVVGAMVLDVAVSCNVLLYVMCVPLVIDCLCCLWFVDVACY